MVRADDSAYALLTTPPIPSISSSTSATGHFVQLPTSSDADVLTIPTSSSPTSSFLSKLTPYRRWFIASAILLILLITAFLTFSLTQSPKGGRGQSGPNVTPTDNITATNSSCAQTKIETEGPYWVDEKLNRSDLSVTATGLNVALELLVFNSTITNKCVPIIGAQVDIWHADAMGLYSDEQILGTKGKTFLRGYQLTNENGVVNFLTIYPGWYSGRTVHMHVRVRVYDSNGKIIHNQTSQLFFDDTINDAVMSGAAPYNGRSGKRDTRNDKDNLYHKELLVNLTGNVKTGYSGSFAFGVPFVR